MPDLSTLIQSGATHVWLYLPLALLLGALHALEPGHAKSVMAAFIIAIRGTAAQAVLLGVSAAVGHTIVVWGLAAVGLYLGDKLVLDKAEPWLVLVTGLLIVSLALRLIWATRRDAHDRALQENGSHDHGSHDHGSHEHQHDGGAGQDHAHDHAHHGHSHASPEEIKATYGGRRVGTFEIVWFGFTGGLMPCPAALAVLLVCLQLKAVTLGIAMVAAFSIGLAVTLVSIGLVAAWGVRKASGWSGFGTFADRLPLLSGLLVLVIGLLFTGRGLFATGLL